MGSEVSYGRDKRVGKGRTRPVCGDGKAPYVDGVRRDTVRWTGPKGHGVPGSGHESNRYSSAFSLH